MSQKILVTGANGYLGRHVVDALVSLGAEVVATDIVAPEQSFPAPFIQADILSGDTDLYHRFGCPNTCIHLAWRDGFVHNSPRHMLDLSKHYAFISDLITQGVKQMVVMGTMHEVGYWEGAITSDTPCNPISLYGIAKDALRKSTLHVGKQNDAIVQWLRAYYICGDDTKNNSIFAKIIDAEAQGQKTFPFTSGKNLYDFIHVGELAKQIAATAVQTQITGIINCCTGKPLSLAQRVEDFIKENNFNITLEYGAFPDRAYDSPGIWGDASQIESIMELQRNKL